MTSWKTLLVVATACVAFASVVLLAKHSSCASMTIAGDQLPMSNKRETDATAQAGFKADRASRETEQAVSRDEAPIHIGVIFNFHAKTQKDKAKKALGAWSRVCKKGKDMNGVSTTLVLSVESDEALDYQKEFEDVIGPELKECFGAFSMISARVPERLDTYPAGASRQFYGMMQELNNTDIDYALVTEPDVIAVRPFWLNEMVRLIRVYESLIPGGFWLLGSIPRGQAVPVSAAPSHRFHINGNAIYHIGDKAFVTFLEKVKENRLAPAPWQSSPLGNAYDVDIMTYLLQPQNYRTSQAVYHKFVHSPFVMNMWRTNWAKDRINSEHPMTFLIHGGTQETEVQQQEREKEQR